MKEWLSKNWDKLLTAVVSTIVAGLIGFFSATRITDDKLSDLRERVARLEEFRKVVKNDRDKTSANTTKLIHLENRFDLMKDRVELAETRVALVKELTEEQRLRTVNELEEILDKYGKIVVSEPSQEGMYKSKALQPNTP